jgi:CheY-like chemotaxis protein
VGSATGSSSSPEGARALHRLRSTLARLKAELELAEVDGTAPPAERLLEGLEEAFVLLTSVEKALHSRGRVLVIDDDARLAEITARGLKRLGYDAEWSAGWRSLSRAEVVVFDLGLVEQLDATAVAALRAARPIVVTGATDRRSRSLAASVAAFAHLIKPVELEDLASAISRRISEG